MDMLSVVFFGLIIMEILSLSWINGGLSLPAASICLFLNAAGINHSFINQERTDKDSMMPMLGPYKRKEELQLPVDQRSCFF